jgi:glutamyl/glutaminyl-tRNA synthetase
MEELPVFEDLQFKENPWGMYCPILEKTIKNKTFIKFDDINDDRSVLSFNYKYLKEINHWMISKDENKDFVNRVKNMLSIYQKPLIDKSMDRIELFNTVLQCMAILETDNLEAIRSKMKKWKMIEGDYKNKAEKFKPRETELMIGLIKDIK